MSIYLLLFDHYGEDENIENVEGEGEKHMDPYCPGDEDTLAGALETAISEMKANSPKYRIGHPIYVKKGLNFVQAKAGSKEAGFRRIGWELKKM